nr:hypothetical protein [Saccharopolyspora sp. HNM0983]
MLGDAQIVNEVFGAPGVECPWRWTNAEPDDGSWHAPQPAARVSIDPGTHTATPDMLGISEQIGARSATFRITQRLGIPAEKLPHHRTVLAVAGQATRSLGAERRRGLGWVSIRCTDVTLDQQSVRDFLALGVTR